MFHFHYYFQCFHNSVSQNISEFISILLLWLRKRIKNGSCLSLQHKIALVYNLKCRRYARWGVQKTDFEIFYIPYNKTNTYRNTIVTTDIHVSIPFISLLQTWKQTFIFKKCIALLSNHFHLNLSKLRTLIFFVLKDITNKQFKITLRFKVVIKVEKKFVVNIHLVVG